MLKTLFRDSASGAYTTLARGLNLGGTMDASITILDMRRPTLCSGA